MLRQFAGVVVAISLAAHLGCRRHGEEDSRPFATPSVKLNRTTAPVGAPIDITYRFVVAPDAPPFAEDYVVFVHFMDDTREQMWTDDHEPATPTRQWKAGQTIEYTHPVLMPKYPYIGEATIEVGLYSATSGIRLPLAGNDVGMRAYRVAAFTLTDEREPVPVTFTDGWYDPESAGEGTQEWRWSKAQGTVAFKNPRRDATLFLQLDQAIQALPEPQRVDLRLGDAIIDSFTLPPAVRELRRVELSAAQLGAADTGRLTVEVSRTVTPADIPALRSPDRRELGVRVFRVYIQPK